MKLFQCWPCCFFMFCLKCVMLFLHVRPSLSPQEMVYNSEGLKPLQYDLIASLLFDWTPRCGAPGGFDGGFGRFQSHRWTMWGDGSSLERGRKNMKRTTSRWPFFHSQWKLRASWYNTPKTLAGIGRWACSHKKGVTRRPVSMEHS